MSHPPENNWEAEVWRLTNAQGLGATELVQTRYRPLVAKMAEAGLAPDGASSLLTEQIRIALDQFSVLADALNIVSDGMQVVMAMSEGDQNPVMVGHSMMKLRAGIAVLADEMANLAPFAGIDDPSFDPVATRAERLEAIHDRDTFLDQIRAAAEGAAE